MVLFLATCSLNKAGGGERVYDEGATIASALSPELRGRLLERREAVRQLVKGDKSLRWQGVPLSQLEFNSGLTKGPDFGGRRDAAYLPAIHRYDGRFLLAMESEGRKKLAESRHQTLFLSGLYGLVRPSEPIQLYSCPLLHQIAERWASDSLLTDVLCDYLERREVARVFDLTAIDAYRRLIDWERVRPRVEVLHCFAATGAGADALVPFGRVLGSDLLDRTEDGLVAVPTDAEVGGIGFRRLDRPPSGYPSEVEEILAAGDEAEILQDLPLESLTEEYLRGGNPETVGRRDGAWQFKATSKFIKDTNAIVGLFDRVIEALTVMREGPTTAHGNTVKPLTRELKGKWRYRIGNHRLVYEPDSARRIVKLLGISHRKDVYD